MTQYMIVEHHNLARRMADTVRYMKNEHSFPIRSVRMHKKHHVVITLEDDCIEADIENMIEYMTKVQRIFGLFVYGEDALTYRGIL